MNDKEELEEFLKKAKARRRRDRRDYFSVANWFFIVVLCIVFSIGMGIVNEWFRFQLWQDMGWVR
jgi:hypothetical protein